MSSCGCNKVVTNIFKTELAVDLKNESKTQNSKFSSSLKTESDRACFALLVYFRAK